MNPQEYAGAWIWVVPTGTMWQPTGVDLAQGYSGHDTPTVQGINNLAVIGLVDVGPLPCGPGGSAGEYTLGPLLPNTQSGTPLSHLGPNICKLIPSAAQRLFILSLKRDPDTFYMHSGVIGEVSFPEPGFPAPTGSEGCICLREPYRMTVLTSPVRRLLCVPAWPLAIST